MPWTVTISVDRDKAATGAEVGTVTGTYTDGSLFAAVPFTFSLRTEFKASARPAVKTAFDTALAAETTARTREAAIAAVVTNLLNN